MGCGASSRAANPPSRGGGGAMRPQFDVSNMFMRSQALTPCVPYKHGTPISEGQLKHQREEFWSTRIGGNVIMWQALQSACEAMVLGDYLLANTIVEVTISKHCGVNGRILYLCLLIQAASITTPNATLDTCYDETGYMYKIPIFLYCNPVELVEGNTPVSISPPVGTEEDNISSRDKETHSGNAIKLKVRINPGDVNMSVTIYSNDTVAQLKRAIQLQSIEVRTLFRWILNLV
jgi:hypothetical protein